MKVDKLRKKEVSFGFRNKSMDDLFESIIQNNAHHLLSKESTNKLNLKDIMSGGIDLTIFSILIMIGANISNNVKQLFILICISRSSRMKKQDIVMPLID